MQRTRSHGEEAQSSDFCRIIIADKNPVVRAGLVDFFSKHDRFDVATAVSSGNDYLEFCDNETADIAVVGWSLLDMDAQKLLTESKRRNIKVRIVVYTSDVNPSLPRKAIKAGAWGFVHKKEDVEMLVDTICQVAHGRICFPWVDINKLSEHPLAALTERERGLLQALANGLTNEQIASRTGISRNTVKYHLKNIYDKLGVNNRAMAVGLFVSIPPDERE